MKQGLLLGSPMVSFSFDKFGGESKLSDVMQKSGNFDMGNLIFRQLQQLCHLARQITHAPAMPCQGRGLHFG